MARVSNQKRRLFLLNHIMLRETDETHFLSVYDLQEELERYGMCVDRRTIESDIQELICLGTDIGKCRDGKRVVYHVVSRDFELAELKLLVDAVQCSRFITKSKSMELIRKLSGLASVYEARELGRDVIIQDRIKYMNESIFYNVDCIQRALSMGKQICFEYLQWDISRKLVSKGSYQLSPWAMIWKDEKYYLVGYDANKRKKRHFRIDKMRKINITNLRREGAAFFSKEELARYSQMYFGMFDGVETKVRLSFLDEKVGLLFDHFGTLIPIWSGGENGWAETEVKVVVSNQFFGWLFSLGDSVQLVAPQSVVERYREVLADAVSKLDNEQNDGMNLQDYRFELRDDLVQTKHRRCKQDLCIRH